jgi:hypothetical protein
MEKRFDVPVGRPPLDPNDNENEVEVQNLKGVM